MSTLTKADGGSDAAILSADRAGVCRPALDLSRLVRKALEALRAYRRSSLAGAELGTLDDRVLRDIGLDRSGPQESLPDYVREPRRGTSLPYFPGI
jgi:uncharacterized protein YjiS (DUF1127 family)